MRTLMVITLALAACGTPDPVAPTASLPVVESAPPLDTNLTQGHARSDHVEVAPGVFLLADLVATGLYRVAAEDPALARRGGQACFNAEAGSSGDELDGEIFGGWVSWGAFASGYSWDDHGVVTNSVSTNAWSQTNLFPIDGIGANQYIYLNNIYLGFVEINLANSDFALTGLYLEVPCDTGYLDLSTFNTMYLRNGDEALQVNNRADSYTVCCP